MDRGVWQGTVHGVTKSLTRLRLSHVLLLSSSLETALFALELGINNDD